MLNFSSLSIKNPVPAILLFILLTLAGLIGFRSSGVQDFPDIELPLVTIDASLPGAAPAQLETEVARKIENSVATLQGVKNVSTKILDGTVSIVVEFILEKDGSDAVNEVRDAVSRVRADLPSELRDPTITKVSTAGKPVAAYVVALANDAALSPAEEESLSWFVDNTLAKKLLSVKGIGQVKRIGGLTREVRVELDSAKMAALNLSALDVSRRIKLVQQESPGGRGDVGGAEQSVRTIATVKTAAELARIELPMPDGRRVRLDQIANVTDTHAERRSLALWNGKPVVGFEVLRTRGASELEVSKQTRDTVTRIAAENKHLSIVEAVDNSWAVAENFDGSMELLYEGALLAIVVVWAFLRNWRATPGQRRRLAAVGHSNLPGPLVFRLHTQYRHADLAGAGCRHSGRRRNCRDRKHRASFENGQDTVPGGDGSGRRNRHGGHCDHLRIGCGLSSNRIYGWNSRQVLQAIWLDCGHCDSGVPGGRSFADTDDGRLPAEALQTCGQARRLDHAHLSGRGSLVPEISMDHGNCVSIVLHLVGFAARSSAEGFCAASRSRPNNGQCRTRAGRNTGSDSGRSRGSPKQNNHAA